MSAPEHAAVPEVTHRRAVHRRIVKAAFELLDEAAEISDAGHDTEDNASDEPDATMSDYTQRAASVLGTEQELVTVAAGDRIAIQRAVLLDVMDHPERAPLTCCAHLANDDDLSSVVYAWARHAGCFECVPDPLAVERKMGRIAATCDVCDGDLGGRAHVVRVPVGRLLVVIRFGECCRELLTIESPRSTKRYPGGDR